MIDVKVSNGEVDIKAVDGRTYKIMAELCCLVRAVCTACWEDVENGNKITEQMILMVSKALKDVKVDIENEKTVF